MDGYNRKRKGFLKGKLVMSLYRSAKPPSANILPNHDKVTPQQKHASSAAALSVGFIMNQDKANPQPKQRVAFVIPDIELDTSYYDMFNNNVSSDRDRVAGDDSVDLKAASYISCVQERFRLERMNSERQMSQDDMTS